MGRRSAHTLGSANSAKPSSSVNATSRKLAARFEVGSFGRRLNRYVYDVSADGQKFLVICPREDASTRPLTVCGTGRSC